MFRGELAVINSGKGGLTVINLVKMIYYESVFCLAAVIPQLPVSRAQDHLGPLVNIYISFTFRGLPSIS